MHKKFDRAVEAVMEFLEQNKYSYSARLTHLRCYKLLRSHYDENGGKYSRDSAVAWLQSVSTKRCEGEVKKFVRALKKLDAAYPYKEIGGTSGKSAMRQIFRDLEPWCNALLEDYITEMSSEFGKDYTSAAKVSVARFLSRMAEIGINDLKEITHRIVVDYCLEGKDVKYSSKQAMSADRSHIRRFLQHFSNKSIVRASVYMALDQTVFSRLVFIDTLEADDRNRYLPETESSDMSAESYYEVAQKLEPIIIELKYAGTAQHTFHIAFKELFVFLEANSLRYTIEIALSWASCMGKFTVQWRTFRRAVMLFEQFKEKGWIDSSKKYNYAPDRAKFLPMWCKADYEAYISKKQKVGLAESTLTMCRNSCLRLMEYLCSTGVYLWNQISPEILKEFHVQDVHATPEGKNAYSSKIRQFLEYLGEIGKIPSALFLAIPSESARRTSIVKTLHKNEIENIYRFKDIADNGIELRDIAMVLLGLRMGLRASDITKLRFIDIMWDQRCISVQQDKTDSFLKLPMPTEVGNAIYRYVTQGRPETDSEFVFVRHKTPYCKLQRTICRTAMLRILQSELCGFHATRKTFASRMLINQVEVGRIAEALGHADNSSVMTYLSTDGDKMRQCAISLDGIPVKGVLS
jgi:integrase